MVGVGSDSRSWDNKKKPDESSGENLVSSGYWDIDECPWTLLFVQDLSLLPAAYSTVTLFAKFLGLSTSLPRTRAA